MTHFPVIYGMRTRKAKSTKKRRHATVVVSGGFDPLHIGHMRMFNEARKHGSKLIVILNNDHWLVGKKGFAFMPQRERKELLLATGVVDEVVITKHKRNDPDRSVCRELAAIKPDVFANGGDRVASNIPEHALCKQLGIKMVFNIGKGGKVQSSSWLINNLFGIQPVETRPWGHMQTLHESNQCWVKVISVLPGHRLSLQKHKKRDEVWVCIKGEVFAEVNGHTKKLNPEEYAGPISIEKETVHRLSSKKGGTIVEIGYGQVSEKDIVRLEDDYGRA